MNKPTDEEWYMFEALSYDHECDERCFDGVFKNPIIPPSKMCKCTHDEAAHWKGKKCRVYACACWKFVSDEDV